MRKNILNFAVIAVAVTLYACKDTTEYRVGSEFEVFIKRFETEAAARNRNFNFESSGLIVEFGNLDKGVAGLCHYNKPIRIEVDETYWKAIGKKDGADLMHEELLFHELGHGILKREHTNAVLSNDEWKSIMCGGDEVAGRTWNINYRGEHRKYYLDELFNESTTVPAFATDAFTADTTNFAQVYNDEFTSATTTKWKLGQTDNGTASIENGMLRFTSTSSVNLMVLVSTTNNIQSDFSFESTFRYSGTDNTANYGLVFGTYSNNNVYPSGTTESLDYFLMNNNKKVTIGNRSWFSYFTQITRNQIIPKELNKIKVVKKADMLYFFINNVYVYRTEISNQQAGYHYGFSIPSLSTLYIDNFRIAESKSASSAAKTKSIGSKEFEIQIVQDRNKFGEVKNK